MEIPDINKVSLELGFSIVLRRPELAVLLGNVASCAALVEWQLAHLYGVLLGSRLQPPQQHGGTRGVQGMLHRFDDIGLQIFEDANTSHVRLKLLRKLVVSQLGKYPEAVAEFGKLIKPIQDAGIARNKIVHGRWAISDDFPDALILMPTVHTGQRVPYNQAAFLEAIETIKTAHFAVNRFEFKTLEWLEKS